MTYRPEVVECMFPVNIDKPTTFYVRSRDVKFVFFQIRTSFLKFEFYSNFVQAQSKN